MPAWLVFLLSAAAVVVAGARLARDGDRIASLTGLGAVWVGAILVAGATSLPEIATDVAAVRQGEIDLAVGDLMGSSMANMLILAVADLLSRQVRLLDTVAIDQAIVGVLAILLTAVATVGIVAGGGPTLLGIGWAPLAIGVAYVLGVRLLYRNRAASATASPEPEPDPRDRRAGLRRALVGFGIATVVILIAAPPLASSAAELARQWGIASGLFGMVFLAAATSLPEVSVVQAAMRAGTYALVVGNLLGSNGFNMVVLLVLDVADGAAPLLADAGPGPVVGALFAILLMGQVLLDLLNRSEHRIWYLEPGPLLMVLTYAAGLLLTWRLTH
jgi:cation:H+ antiporter